MSAANYCTAPRTMIRSQTQPTETRELEDLITDPMSSNSRLRGPSLTAVFGLSGVMSHVTYMLIWHCKCCLFWLYYSSFQELGGYTHTVR
jgi:hypothetical protein